MLGFSNLNGDLAFVQVRDEDTAATLLVQQ